MITDVPGIRAGHWSGAATGVTVVLAPAGCVGGGEVRGGAPATREAALVESGALVEHVDAVVFTGGSAFGLAACDGVMAFLAERGQGFPTAAGPVPIVVGAAVYDLTAGELRPGPAEGRAAAEAAEAGDPVAVGRVGAGTGCRVGKWKGPEHGAPGGVGSASAAAGDLVVGALAVVNAVGDVVGADGAVLAGSEAPEGTAAFGRGRPFESTVLVAVATNAALTKAEAKLVAQSAHHGVARSVHPSHTRYDGDLAVCLATGEAGGSVDEVRVLATEVVAAAVRGAVT